MLRKLYKTGFGYGLCALLAYAVNCSGNTPEQSTAKSTTPGQFKANLRSDPDGSAAMVKKLNTEEKTLRYQQLERLKAFATEKEKQARDLASDAGETVSTEAHDYFESVKKGDFAAAKNRMEDFVKRHPYFANSSRDKALATSYWQTIMEVDMTRECVILMEPKTLESFVTDTINSIPPGSIYFGGTDSGRGLITTFCKSHPDADPFFTLTQNALADNTYLAYLRRMYGRKIYIPTEEDSRKCFSDYMKDAQARLAHDQEHPEEPRQIRPGEDVHLTEDGQVKVAGQVAVMEINGLLAKAIFDHNPEKEFYIEESFPLNWMYPYLEPHGPIMKVNRRKLGELPQATVTKDREYWRAIMKADLGDWLTEETPIPAEARFVEKVYLRKDLGGFSGNEPFLESNFAQKMVSKLRSSTAGLYEWRSKHATSSVEKDRMTKEADLAYRQAFALCPYSPEAVFRYAGFLANLNRIDDAKLVVSASLTVDPSNEQIASLLKQLKQYRQK